MPDREILKTVFPEPSDSSKSLGFDLISLDMTAMAARVRFDGRQEFANPAGYVQGGFLSAMLDDTMGMLAAVKMKGRAMPSTIDLHTTFVRPVRVGEIEVAARIRNVGRQIIFADAVLFDKRGKEAARSLASLAINPMKAPAR